MFQVKFVIIIVTTHIFNRKTNIFTCGIWCWSANGTATSTPGSNSSDCLLDIEDEGSRVQVWNYLDCGT